MKRNVLWILKTTLERGLLGAPENTFALLVKGTEGTAFILHTLNTDMMPTLWPSITGMKTKAYIKGG